MIRDRSEYRFVDIPNEIRVNGQIMPYRDVVGYGSSVLRGEDPAFLLEGAGWLNYVVNGIEQEKETIDRRVSGNPFSSAIFRFEDVADKMPSHDRPTLPMTQEFQSPMVWNVCPSIWPHHGSSNLASNRADFSAGNPLFGDSCRRAFWDLSKLDRFYAGGAITHTPSVADCVWIDLQYDPSLLKPQLGSQWYYKGRSRNRYEAFYAESCAPSLQIGAYRENLSDRIGTVSACYAMCQVDHGSSNGGWTKYIAVRVVTVVEDGFIKVYGGQMQTIAQHIEDFTGVYIPKSIPTSNGEYSWFTVIPLSFQFVYSLDLPTDFGEIGWQWEPAN